MRTRFLRFLRFLPFLLSALSSCVAAAEACERCIGNEARREVAREADEREEKQQFKSLWRQLSREEREALRQQMREAWHRLTPEERQRTIVIARRSEGRRESLDSKDEEHHRMRRNDEKGHTHKDHKAYWERLSAEERAALRENLRASLRAMRLRRCPPSQNPAPEFGKQGTEKGCGKAGDR
jgi:hypothetical protein